MKRKIIAVIAALALSLTALASCGDSSSMTPEMKGYEAGANKDEKPRKAIENAEKLYNSLTWKDELNYVEEDLIEKRANQFYGITKDMYTSGLIYFGSGATAEEIACFDAVDADAAEKIKKGFEKRVADQKKAFENYVPGELVKLDAAIVKVDGLCVYLCITDDSAKAAELIG